MTRCAFILLILIQFILAGCKPNDPPVVAIPVDPASIGLDTNWHIGYSAGNTYTPDQFRPCTVTDKSHVIVMCHPARGQSGYYPYTGRNNSATTQTDATNNWAAKAGEIVMEGSNDGQYSMLYFKVPATGMYKIKAVFEGIHFGLPSTDVHILHNSQSLFDDFIEGYGGDTLYHGITGSHPVTSYEDTIQLNKDDTITFAVGYGSNKTHYSDTTGLQVSIDII
jgi:hypothetical protein